MYRHIIREYLGGTMKLITLLLMSLSFIACEQAADSGDTSSETAEVMISSIDPAFYGVYESGCIELNSSFTDSLHGQVSVPGRALKIKATLTEQGAQVQYQYGRYDIHGCRIDEYERYEFTHDVDFTLTRKTLGNGAVREFLEIEHKTTGLFIDTTMIYGEGSTVCGIDANNFFDQSYELINEECGFNKTDKKDKYRIMNTDNTHLTLTHLSNGASYDLTRK